MLHCNGSMAEMVEVATEAKPLEGPWLKRAEQALSHLREPVEFDRIVAAARLKEFLVA